MKRSVVEKRSYDSVEVFWLNRQEALHRLRQSAAAVTRSCHEVLGVYLFGSLAEDRAVPGSDADILILLSSSDRRWIDRPLKFQRFFDGIGLPLDLFCYTEAESRTVSIAEEALARGIRLDDDVVAGEP